MFEHLSRCLAAAIAVAMPLGVAHAQTATTKVPSGSGRLNSKSGRITVEMKREFGHLFVNAMLNGKPIRGILDTGAGAMVMSPEAAQRCGLRIRDNGGVDVVGAGKTRGSWGTADTISLRELEMRDIAVVVVPFPEALKCDFIFGRPFFESFVTTLDYAADEITIALPGRESTPANAVVLEMNPDAKGGTPSIRGLFEGIPGEFTVDTGADDALTLFAPFVDKHGLRSKYEKRIPKIGAGMGGLFRGELVRAKSLVLGNNSVGVTLPDPIVELSQQSEGAFATSDFAGNLGSGILERFTVQFNYKKRQMLLVPNTNFKNAYRQNRTGMNLMPVGGILRVLGVNAGTPAERAGIVEGDEIIRIDELTLTSQNIQKGRERLQQRSGTTVRFLVRRKVDSSLLEIPIALEDQL